MTDQVKTSRKQTVVAVAKPDASYFDLCVEVLLEQSEQSGIELICRFVGSAQGDDLDLSLHAEPLGIVVFGHNLSALAHGLQARGHRVVLVATPFIGEVFDVPCVYGQQDRGGYLLARHLVDLGHRHFCLCATPEWNLALRSRGHDKAMREADLAGHRVKKTIINQAVVDTWIDKPSLAAEFFAADDAPTAIVMWNDRMAMALIATLSRAGLNVPGDVSVVGYDYLAAGQLGHPSLTTIDPSVRLQVAAAVDLITETDDLKPSQSVVFAPTLVVGESTAPPKSPRLR